MTAARAVIYQLVVRLFGNTNETRKKDGRLEENGVGKFADIDDRALASLKALGVTHLWLTGILRHATLTDYAAYGLPADPADVVKGRAGSFYAVRDYYDVSPDYAVDPGKRHEELDALLDRIHRAGLKVMMDLVPNHVARGYASTLKPETDFGRADDTTQFFSPSNNYFYLVEPRGQMLELTKPPHWNPEGARFSGRFAKEDGSPGHPPKATGNNVTSPRPSADDWYETVKLNYGRSFVDGASSYSPIPDTWKKVDAILAHWQARGFDGFRCDFAHYIPREAWSYLISRAKERDLESLVIAEAYEDIEGMLSAGFDAVYHFEAYNLLKRVYTGEAGVRDIEAFLGSGTDEQRARFVMYLENHDERRIASPIVRGRGTGERGFGSANAAKQLAPIMFLSSRGPVLLYNGQEVGEDGSGDEGFGGEDGRTTIFDYGAMPAMARWVNGHAYDGGRLTESERNLRRYYGDLLRVAGDPRIASGSHAHLIVTDEVYSFGRFLPDAGSILVVVANFAVSRSIAARIRIPASVAKAAGISSETKVRIRVTLDGAGAKDDLLVSGIAARDLDADGFEVRIEDQSASVLTIERSEIS